MEGCKQFGVAERASFAIWGAKTCRKGFEEPRMVHSLSSPWTRLPHNDLTSCTTNNAPRTSATCKFEHQQRIATH